MNKIFFSRNISKLQNYLVFILTKNFIKSFNGTTRIDSWKSNGILGENIQNTTKSNSTLAATFVGHNLQQDSFNFLYTNSMLKKFKLIFYVK